MRRRGISKKLRGKHLEWRLRRGFSLLKNRLKKRTGLTPKQRLIFDMWGRGEGTHQFKGKNQQKSQFPRFAGRKWQ